MGPRHVCILLMLFTNPVVSQINEFFPFHTKWYQDPLGFRPVELSSAMGFIWGSAAVTACLILTKKDTLLQKKIFLYEDAGAYFGYKPPYTSAFQNNTGVLYTLRPWMSVGAEFSVMHFSDNINNTNGFGVRPFARWYFARTKRIKFFFDYGAGISYSIDRFPLTGTGIKPDTARTGTRFNFITRYGAGAEWRLSNKINLQVGARHTHLSNGNIRGIGRNPSFDGNGAFIGMLYKIFDTPRFN